MRLVAPSLKITARCEDYPIVAVYNWFRSLAIKSLNSAGTRKFISVPKLHFILQKNIFVLKHERDASGRLNCFRQFYPEVHI